MKVALIDNMNNCFFSMSRYLRDLGVDANLYEVSNSQIYFRPKDDTFKDTSKMDWIHNFPVDITPKSWIFLDKESIANEFEGYDLVISSGLSSAYLEKAGVLSDIIIPFGSDLYAMPFYKFKFSLSVKESLKSLIRADYAKYQKRAYLKTRAVAIQAGSKLYEEPLLKLNINWLDIHPPMLYTLEDTSNIDLKDYVDIEVLKSLEESEFVVFNHSRQYWATNEDNLEDFDKFLGLKRNDRVIRAFAKFLERTKLKSPKLVLFEYGQDVKYSKELVSELNIEDSVIWMPKSPRKVIRILLQRYCNLGTDQFREGISMGLTSVAYEVLSSGVPLLAHTAKMDNFYSTSPIIEALKMQDILDKFIDYEKNPSKYKEIGEESKKWFDDNLGVGLAKEYIKMFEFFIEDKTLTQNDKKIREIFKILQTNGKV